jgi:glycosyltransferase involved in cell wall biosynthesis
LEPDSFQSSILSQLEEISNRLTQIENKLGRPAWRARRPSFWERFMRPPMWTFEQYAPRALHLESFSPGPILPANAPSMAIVTPSYNHAKYLSATIESILSQNYPQLRYHVQDGGSSDGTIELLKTYDGRIKWRSERDSGQSHAINMGFADVTGDIMAYLNSDDLLLPGTLARVANFFIVNPEVDIVYGHRIFIDRDDLEIGRAVLPPFNGNTLRYADYIPQETMFWRKRVWDAIGPIDQNFHYAMDWDFILRAQAAGFKFKRIPHFLACFRVHDEQKTAVSVAIGTREMASLRKRVLGFAPNHVDIRRAVAPFIALQFAYHFGYKLGLIRHR